MSKQTPSWNFEKLITDEIKKKGGWVNTHVHGDRAFTITVDSLDIYKKHSLEEKWDLVDAVKNASIDEYYRRMSMALELMISQGVTAVGSFIDVDPVCEDRAIKGALKAREKYEKQITVKFINQVLKGVIKPDARKWFDIGAEYADIIGGLPKRDERDYGKGEEHIDILMQTAKKMHKMVHIHVDQFNTVNDKETELICDKTIQYGMQGKVVAVHCISVGAHPKVYRDKLYKKLKKAQVMVVACPTAWIDSKRSEVLQPFHNSITPVDELVPAGIIVGLGTDNIADYMVPFCDGDMWKELRMLATACRFVEINSLIDIATINGRKILGIQ